jgi:hypothetical protein
MIANVVIACSDHRAAATAVSAPTTAAPAATAAPTPTAALAATAPPADSADDPNGERAPDTAATGSVVMSVEGTTVFEGEVTHCTLVIPDLQLTAQGETAEMEIASYGEGSVSVTVTGAFEFGGDGYVDFGPDTGIDTGTATISGGGAAPDTTGELQAFEVQISIQSC